MDIKNETEKLAKKIESMMLSQLEVEQQKKEGHEPIGYGWLQIEERKWEYYHHYIPIGTIYHKATGQYSLWFKSPMIFADHGISTFKTHQYSTFDEAKEKFFEHLTKEAFQWCNAVVGACEGIIADEDRANS